VRLWTLHPKYLDPQGLVALWREALLARSVIRGLTRGYRHHPQLRRFQSHVAPRSAISSYLAVVCEEAKLRGYSFDSSKVGPSRSRIQIFATTGQVNYEWRHLLRKLRARSPTVYLRWRGLEDREPHPMFEVISGPVEQWERTVAGRSTRASAVI
jgi:hypothetical protein